MSKVLFVATVTQKHINAFHLPFLNMFKEKGWETYVAAKNDFEIKNELKIPNCDFYYDVDFSRNPLSIQNFKAYRDLKKIMYDNEFDIIHCHTPIAGALARIAAKKTRKNNGTKVIYTAHGFHFFKGAPIKNWLLYYPVEKILAKLTDVLITLNIEDYKLAKEKLNAKVAKLVPGVGIDDKFISKEPPNIKLIEELRVTKNEKLLLSVGELNDNKNHKLMIKCLSSLPENYHYIIVGKGQLEEKLRVLAMKYGIADRVHFLGYRSDVISIMKISDILIFPSKREGLPLTIIEALNVGLPIIASNIRGNKDLINSKIRGELFESNNLESLISKIKNFDLDDSKNIDPTVKEYGLDNILKEMEKIYF